MRVRQLLFILCCASCGPVQGGALRTLEVPVPVTNQDRFYLTAHYTPPATEEFVTFYRTFYDHFPHAYRDQCPQPRCFAGPQVIVMEEVRDTSVSTPKVRVSTRDHSGRPLYIRRFLLERTADLVLTARRATTWVIRGLQRGAGMH
ncbi:MAG: hypothetical protein AB1671_09345 [Thermodesulfobacteriota bacterium]|jgi:hypothetical protein